jgi:ribosome-associated heat shock protein Hsp15
VSGRETVEAIRVDKWLWAARFFKTRGAATEAVHGGKVAVNGDPAKPARSVTVGDTIEVRLPPYRWIVEVTGIAGRRGSAEAAATLFRETDASREARERQARQLRDAPLLRFDDGKPGKRDRRTIRRLKGK